MKSKNQEPAEKSPNTATVIAIGTLNTAIILALWLLSGAHV